MDALYTIGVALTLSTTGFTPGALSALNVFKDLESAATAADTAASRFTPRLATSFASLEQAAGGTSAAFADAQASLAALTAPGGLTLTNMDAHRANMDALTAAQADLSTQQASYNQLLTEQATAATAAGAAQDKLLASNKAMQGMLLGGAGVMVGVAGIGVMKDWLNQAGQMQDAMVQVGQAATGTPAQLKQLQNQAYTVAGQMQFSAPQIAGMEQMMARMGFRDLAGQMTQRQVIAQAVPEFARAAEIEAHFTGASAQETVEALTMHAHQFGVYSGPQLASMVSMAVGANMASGMSLQQQSNVLRYLQPAVKGLHMSAEDAYALAALSNETGLSSGRGGSNLGALFRYMMPIGTTTQKNALTQVEALGGGDFFQNGRFVGVSRALDIINRFLHAPGLTDQQRQTDLVGAFRVQGAQAASLLGNDTAIKQFEAITKAIAGYTPEKLIQMQEQLNRTLPGTVATLTSDFGSLASMMGQSLMPAATGATRSLASFTNQLVSFGEQNPGAVKATAAFVALGTIFTTLSGAALLARSAFAALNIAGIGAGIGLGTAALSLGALTGGLAAFALLFADWDNVMAATSGSLQKVSFWTGALTELLASLFAPLIAFYRVLQGLADLLPGFHQKPSATTAAGVPPPHAGDKFVNGQWYLPNGRPDTAAAQVAQQRARAQTIHLGKIEQHFHLAAGSDEHKISAAVKKATGDTLAELGNGADWTANYGPTFPFTTNPTLRSNGQ